MRYLFLFLLFLASSKVLADAEILPVAKFSDIQSIVKSLGKNAAQSTLIVMDDDDTLTMMTCEKPESPKDCQYLGGPAWYAWQSDLLSQNPKSPFLVADNEEDLLKIAALLLSINNMPYTDEAIPSVLSKLSKKGAHLLVLTARGPSNTSATLDQFSQLFLSKKKEKTFLSLIQNNALTSKVSNTPSFAGPFMPEDCNVQRATIYQQGVMLVAGQNKGLMLQCFLQHTESDHIKNIIFIDDTLKNVEDVYTEFESSKKFTVTALHYTLLEAHKNQFTQTPPSGSVNPFQVEAHKRWALIKSVLKSELLDPAALTP